MKIREKVFSLTTILSKSDLYGNITWVNEKLRSIPKYKAEELISKPHNIQASCYATCSGLNLPGNH